MFGIGICQEGVLVVINHYREVVLSFGEWLSVGEGLIDYKSSF